MRLSFLGGTPVRARLPEPRPRLNEDEAGGVRAALAGAADWSRAGEDWPLPCLDRLEEEWARAHGARHAVAVSSGTAALTLILRALGLQPGDEVLIPAYGCPAVDVAVLAAGLTPVHVEIDPGTYGMAPAAAAAAVTPGTAAIVAVHFGGGPSGLEALRRVAERNGIALVEDACLAPGAVYDGRRVGTWGRASAFSLGVRKPITAGEGGLVVTDDAALAAAIRHMRSLGADQDTGDIRDPSGNFRLTELQAAVAIPQLARLGAELQRRERAAIEIEAALAGTRHFRPLDRDPLLERHGRAQLWIRYVEDGTSVPRARVAEAVQAEGIPLFEGWPRPNYCLGVYTPARAAEWLRARGASLPAEHYSRTCCPNAERAAFEEGLMLDFPILDAEPPVIRDAAEAVVKVGANLAELTGGRGCAP